MEYTFIKISAFFCLKIWRIRFFDISLRRLQKKKKIVFFDYMFNLGGNSYKEERVNEMKKFILSVFTLLSVLSGAQHIAVAANNNDFKVRFRENTLVVTSPAMTEARIYNENGKLLMKEQGQLAEFDLERGSYKLYAKVDGQTVSRRIELR